MMSDEDLQSAIETTIQNGRKQTNLDFTGAIEKTGRANAGAVIQEARQITQPQQFSLVVTSLESSLATLDPCTYLSNNPESYTGSWDPIDFNEYLESSDPMNPPFLSAPTVHRINLTPAYRRSLPQMATLNPNAMWETIPEHQSSIRRDGKCICCALILFFFLLTFQSSTESYPNSCTRAHQSQPAQASSSFFFVWYLQQPRGRLGQWRLLLSFLLILTLLNLIRLSYLLVINGLLLYMHKKNIHMMQPYARRLMCQIPSLVALPQF